MTPKSPCSICGRSITHNIVARAAHMRACAAKRERLPPRSAQDWADYWGDPQRQRSHADAAWLAERPLGEKA